MSFLVREQQQEDWPVVWSILEPVFRSGDSYPLPRDVSERDAKEYWLKTDGYNGVVFDEGDALLGAYYLRPDQGGPGSHVCNAGYVIAAAARGRHLATPLCLQSQEQARSMGFKAMKFNLVVSTNAAAINAWVKAGMEIIGTAPGAFQLPDGRVVDAHIMYKSL